MLYYESNSLQYSFINNMEEQASKFLKNKEWSRAIDLYTKLLQHKPISKQQIVSYLLARSECFLELGKHEAVVADCKTVMKLLADGNEDNNGNRARKRLVHALYAMKRFKEAEIAIREWLTILKMTKDMEVKELLENLLESFVNVKSKQGMDQLLRNLEMTFTRNLNKSSDIPTCIYCNLIFRDKSELRVHCQSEAHELVLMSDDGHDWKWRAPPRGFQSDTYVLCENWKETGCCRFGIQCVEAHGIDELAEWKERFSYRQMKLQRAREKELYGKSYTEELLEKWAQSRETMKDTVQDVSIKCSSPLMATVSSKNSVYEWFFHISTKKPLKVVALLVDTHRNHFNIGQVINQNGVNKVKNNQEWLCPDQLKESSVPVEYRIQINFSTTIFGTFRQSVVFDFGMEPVLVKHLSVDVVPDLDLDKFNEIRREITLSMSERWTPINSNIIKFSSSLVSYSAHDEWEQKLLDLYKCPHNENFSLSHSTMIEKKFTRNNYRERMHELLFVEEMARYDLTAQYNLTTKIQIIHSYILSPNSMAASTAKYSCNGELFALIPLGKELSEDTSEGRLILMHCMAVYFSPTSVQSQSKNTVYEAYIEDKGKNVIYLRLSSRTVQDLNLHPEDVLEAQIQFQLNRIPYCEWHYTLDKMPNFKLIFPDTFLEPSIPWSPQRQWNKSVDPRLNAKQKEAVVALTTPLNIQLPPILVIGPFGTGKTFTLAQGVKELIKDPNNKILLCTHSNSAADLYIRDYFHRWVEDGDTNARPLRIYYKKRWVTTINPIVQKYCLIQSNGAARSIRMPAIGDIQKHQIIVVTLSTSVYLSLVGLPKGYFTHILLDEAAQAIECETITPLALATDSTRIVLAGDHMQLGPDIFSSFARERGLHVSLLERLYDHYPSNFSCKILLCENYRAHEAIIQFTSESFYDQKLVASSKQPPHGSFYPLTFFTTRGEDVQDKNSTAFYNNSEVYEVVERVAELKKNWPVSWGELNDQSIGVVTPYSDQVFRLRAELKKRRIDNICVERVANVQGKQFRVILLSTVRTRKTCTAIKGDTNADFGFLSNSKLLNTAVTRAQSLVAVVGDPVALSSLGRCSKVWERYIQVCRDNSSLFGITWTQLKCQLDGIELKKIYSLNPLAPEFIPRKYREMRCFVVKQNVSQTVNMQNVSVTHQLPAVTTNQPIMKSGLMPNITSQPVVKPGPPCPISCSPVLANNSQVTVPVNCQNGPPAHVNCLPPLIQPPTMTTHVPLAPPHGHRLPLHCGTVISNGCQTSTHCPPPMHCTPAPSHYPSLPSHCPLPITNNQHLKNNCSTVVSHDLPMVTHSTHLQNHPIATTATSNNPTLPPCILPYPMLPQETGLFPLLYPPTVPVPLPRHLPYGLPMADGVTPVLRHAGEANYLSVSQKVQNGFINQQKLMNVFQGKPVLSTQASKDQKQKGSASKLIQFMNNVHLPENQLVNDCINLLPHDMTLADMLVQPPYIQERWYRHLSETVGAEAAEKLKYLLHSTCRKDSMMSEDGLFDFNSKQTSCDSPTCCWFDTPSNQVNLNKSVYMRDETLPSTHHTNSIKSNPLYQRKPSVDPLYSNHLGNMSQAPDSERQVNDQVANLCINSTDDDMEKILKTLCKTNFLTSNNSLTNNSNHLVTPPFYRFSL